MSPLWGFKTFGCPVLYKHAAPLGLNTSTLLRLCVKYSFHSCRLASIRGGLPLFTFHVSRSHMSPRWGFRILGCPVFYKHVAPLGLNTSTLLRLCVKYSFHSCRLAPIRGGLPLFTWRDSRHASTCRPSGALRHLVVPFSINMSPRWG